jgi:predicted RNA-binding protein with RPS1 domain
MNAKRKESSGSSDLPQLYSIIRGEVVSIQQYGVFVKIPGCSKNGLVHISQMSSTRVEQASEVCEVGEKIHCKVISIEPDGSKIALSMKVVNQSTGQDLDPNQVQTTQDSQKKKKSFQREIPRIELGAVFDTTCKKCRGRGHLAQDCFHRPGEQAYELIEETYAWPTRIECSTVTQPSQHKMKKKKKEKKSKKEKTSKKDKKKKSKEKKRKRMHLESASCGDSESLCSTNEKRTGDLSQSITSDLHHRISGDKRERQSDKFDSKTKHGSKRMSLKNEISLETKSALKRRHLSDEVVSEAFEQKRRPSMSQQKDLPTSSNKSYKRSRSESSSSRSRSTERETMKREGALGQEEVPKTSRDGEQKCRYEGMRIVDHERSKKRGNERLGHQGMEMWE